MQKAILNLEPLSCPSCSQKIANAVKGLDGVDQNSVKVLFNASKIRTNFNAEQITIEAIEKEVQDLGYPVLSTKAKKNEET